MNKKLQPVSLLYGTGQEWLQHTVVTPEELSKALLMGQPTNRGVVSLPQNDLSRVLMHSDLLPSDPPEPEDGYLSLIAALQHTLGAIAAEIQRDRHHPDRSKRQKTLRTLEKRSRFARTPEESAQLFQEADEFLEKLNGNYAVAQQVPVGPAPSKNRGKSDLDT